MLLANLKNVSEIYKVDLDTAESFWGKTELSSFFWCQDDQIKLLKHHNVHIIFNRSQSLAKVYVDLKKGIHGKYLGKGHHGLFGLLVYFELKLYLEVIMPPCPLVILLINLGHSQSTWVILGHFESTWLICVNLGHFQSIQVNLGQLWSIWVNLGQLSLVWFGASWSVRAWC